MVRLLLRNAKNKSTATGVLFTGPSSAGGEHSRGHQLFTNSDTEAILRLYEDFGADCVQHLRGMFAFAIWDSVDRSLFIARDRVGKKPLLYSHRSNGDLVFGSEFTALLEHPAVSREIDHQAIDAYLSFTCVPAPMGKIRAS